MKRKYLNSVKGLAVVILVLALSCTPIIFFYSPYIEDSEVTLEKRERLIRSLETTDNQLERATMVNYFRTQQRAAVDDLNVHRSARTIFIIFGIVLALASVIQLLMIAGLKKQLTRSDN